VPLSVSNAFQLAQSFVATAESATTLEELERALRDTCTVLGVSDCAILGRTRSAGSRVREPRILVPMASRDWSAHYWATHLYNSDPVIHRALTSMRPFTWREIEARIGKESPLFAQCRDAVGVTDAYLVPMHTESGMDGCAAFYHSREDTDSPDFAALRLISILAVERALELTQIMFDDEAEAPAKCLLTARQREVLAFGLQGKSDWDIAQILGLAEGTVHEHFERAKSRLGVRTRVQAAGIALSRGWIVH
jgi:DNA-binding CsgD family transcriptional regulator